MSKYEGTMNTRKQREKAWKVAIKRIENGQWFRDFCAAFEENNITMCELLYFEVANKNYPDKKDWSRHKINVLKGTEDENQGIKQMKKLINSRR